MRKHMYILLAGVVCLAGCMSHDNIVEATRHGDVARVKQLIQSEPGLVSYQDKNGHTALDWAAMTGNLEIAKFLIEHGADVNVRNNRDGTPLHAAAFRGNEAVVRLLVEHGADVNAHGFNGATPLDGAVEAEHKSIADFLRSHGAVLNNAKKTTGN